MTLFDTNVVIDARDNSSGFGARSAALIAGAVLHEGAAINAIVFAELCVGQTEFAGVEAELRAAGFHIVDIPAAASPICGKAYTRYRLARKRSKGGDAPSTPLPDFFIGAHAELMGWDLATRDSERFRLYFPKVKLVEPGE
jgi:predicted nucleic acid-binding protein